MAKKQQYIEEDAQRESRKEILRRRRLAQQTRTLKLAIGGVAGILGILLLIAIADLYFVSPNRSVAVVGETKITLREWQARVRYERAQRIILLENQLQALGGDVGIIQQFAGQMIVDLQDAEVLAQEVLDQMVNEVVIRQMAEARGITVSEADIDAEIGEIFSYFGGNSPTPFPEPTETIMPTPSLTPLPTSVITEVVPTVTPIPTSTVGPTSTPFPTATPVSEEVFQEEFGDLMSQFRDLGVDEDTYRSVVRQQLYREQLVEIVSEENELVTAGEHVSVYLLSFDLQAGADAALDLIEQGDYLTVWNTIRSAPSELDFTGTASELLWRTQEDLASSLGVELSEIAFNLPVGEPSEVLEQVVDAETSNFLILQVSGREVREFSASAIQQDKAELLSSVIDQQLTGNLESTDFWRSRIPRQPVLDPKFLAPPTPTPPLGLPETESLPTPDDGS